MKKMILLSMFGLFATGTAFADPYVLLKSNSGEYESVLSSLRQQGFAIPNDFKCPGANMIRITPDSKSRNVKMACVMPKNADLSMNLQDVQEKVLGGASDNPIVAEQGNEQNVIFNLNSSEQAMQTNEQASEGNERGAASKPQTKGISINIIGGIERAAIRSQTFIYEILN